MNDASVSVHVATEGLGAVCVDKKEFSAALNYVLIQWLICHKGEITYLRTRSCMAISSTLFNNDYL